MGQFAGIALIWFIIEILIWYAIAQHTSGWYVFLWFIVAFFIGLTLILKGMKTLSPMAQQVKSGNMMNTGTRPDENRVMKSTAIAGAGLLLAIPGVMSDIFALLLLLPPVQNKIKASATNYVMKNQEKMMEMMSRQMGGQAGGQNPFGQMGGQQNPFGGMNGQNPFGGGQNPFGGNSPFGGQSPFGHQPTTVDGTAKTINKDAKKLESANDDK